MRTLIGRVVSACAERRWLTLAIVSVLAAAAYVYTARHFAIDTDIGRLIGEDVPWRKQELIFDGAFPHRTGLIAVVVDGATPEAAEAATAALAARLSNEPRVIRSVWRPDGGAFFARAGLLFQPTAEVAQAMQSLIAAEPLLGAMAADPSLRGLMEALSRSVQGVENDPARVSALARPLERISDVFAAAGEGRTLPFSWREMMTGRPAEARELRRFILVQPVLDYGALQPGEAASAAIREAARALQLDGDGAGIRVRLTGPVPLADEEFATLADGAALNVALMALALSVLLWAALRSWRLIVAIALCLAVGLVVTAAFALCTFGPFNLISVAFAVLFVGLGVDFGIQFGVAYRARQSAGSDCRGALESAGEDIGWALALAAAAIAAGFFSFLPTEYRGVSELGVIAGTGMLVAFVATITMLPALIAALGPDGRHAIAGYPALSALDRLLLKHRRLVIFAAFVVAAASVALLPWLEFDVDPLHLKSARAESVSTLFDLMRDPATTPNTIEVLAQSLDEAAVLARRLQQLPEVDHAVTLASFVPEDQAAKLALVDDAALLLDPVINPGSVRAAPTDGETVGAMLAAAQALEQRAASWPQPAAATATRFARALRTVAEGAPSLRERARAMLIPGLVVTLEQLRAAMQAKPVRLADLPDDLRRDWVAYDGRARIELFPRGDASDNTTRQRFVNAVRTIAPEATGAPVSILESGRMIARAFIEAGVWALLSIVALLAVALRSARYVLLTLAPLVVSGLATLGICAAIGLPVNFENIIALPLLLGIGVAFSIYFVVAWRDGKRELLQSSLTRAVIFSALTTGTAFGSLWLSRHPGTSSMGELLALSLACTLVCTLLVLPALLAGSERDRGHRDDVE